jgi:YHS domain-containing protein
LTSDITHQGEHHDAAGDATCPVCRARVNTATAPSRTFDGETWFFCNDKCLRAFEARPRFYVDRARAEGLAGTHKSSNA